MEFIPEDMKEIITKFDYETKFSSITRYGKILKFIKPLEECPQNLGKWKPAESRTDENGQTVITMGYPIYESDVIDFLDAMGSFMVYNYVEVIESYGIKYENIDIHKLDLTQYDDKLVLAMITAIIRSDRINEGLIMSMIENGSFLKLLLRLKDFDAPLLKEDIITKISYSFSCFGDFTKDEGFVIDILLKDKIRVEYQAHDIDSINPVVVLGAADSQTLITKLYHLNILEWESEYEPKDMVVMDGESWQMEIDTYNLGHITKAGHNAFPANWHSFRNFRRWLLSKMRK